MEEVDIALIKKRSIKGIFALTYRTFAIQVIGFSANFVLTIFLSPEVFGIYFVVTAVIAFLTYFSDVGLAAALIQKKENISEEDLRTTFTIQQGLVISISLIALISSSFVKDFYKLDSDGVFLFQALVISFFLSSLKTIPSIILERELKFEKLVIPQIAETLVFNVIAVFMAMQGFGVASFSIAVLARGVIGLVLIYIISPWKIGLGFSGSAARKLLSYGIPFQANSFIALLKDDLFIVYLGKVLPLAQVGYIGFAQKWAYTPLRLIMDNMIKITFPSFSRLQENRNLLGKAVEKSIFSSAFVIFPLIAGLITLSPYFIKIIPKYEKLEPALLSLAFFSLNACLSSISTPLTNALNAIGKIKITLYLMIFWTVATWLITPLMIFLLGFNGVALSSFIISLSVFLVVILVKKYIIFSLYSLIYPFFSALIMTAILFILMNVFPTTIFTIVAGVVLGAIIYTVLMFSFARKIILADIKLIKENVFKK